MPDGLLNRWYERRSHAQKPHAGVQKHGNRVRLTCKFAANANRRITGLFHSKAYQPENDRVVVLVITVDQGILPPSGHGVLCQVIGTQTQRIGEAQNARHRQSRCGSLYHGYEGWDLSDAQF